MPVVTYRIDITADALADADWQQVAQYEVEAVSEEVVETLGCIRAFLSDDADAQAKAVATYRKIHDLSGSWEDDAVAKLLREATADT